METTSVRVRHALRRTSTTIVTIAAVAISISACGSSSSGSSGGGAGNIYGFKAATQSAGTLTVWVDSTRLPIVKEYAATHPNVKLNIVTYDGDANGSNTFKTKMELFNRAGSGWPDVVFTEDNNSASWGSMEGTRDLAPLNKGLVSTPTLNGFATGSLSPCTVNGTVYCLRNDLAFNVLWDNAALMKKFGYKVPTTWEQYQALSDEVAKQHPGYIMGTAGDAWTPEMYMWGAQCPASDVTGPQQITVNTADPNCVKAAKMIDHMIANKTMSTQALFGPDFIKSADKVLMLPGPSWYGGSLLQGYLKTPKGQVAVAAPLTWSDSSQKVTGDVGGGAWWISSHSTHLAADVALLKWVTTQYMYGKSLNPGYPADTATAAKWLAATQSSGYYANDIAPIMEAAAGKVWSGWTPPAFSQESVWAATVQPAITAGKTVESMLPAWGTAIANQAKILGYTVSK